MCGFVGGTVPGADYERGLQRILHRGPDDQHRFADHRVTMSFARLAVVDLDRRARQPMVSDDGEVVVVFNGEIYGFRQLRRTLQNLGHPFRSQSDTEVLLRAYLQWGDEFVQHLDGMFAIACYDRRSGELKLWRDRVGIKPLFYYWDERDFLFASEIKAIQALVPAATRPRLDAYYDFLTYQCVPAPKTSFQNVFQLRPAHAVRLDLDANRLDDQKAYWNLEPQSDRSLRGERAAAAIREAIGTAVADQLIADVPVGCFLSGGIDSSIVAYEASRRAEGLKTFSIGFTAEKNELPVARRTAALLHTDHRERVVPQSDVQIESLLEWFDEPFADLSAFPTRCVAGVARDEVTVALSGDGGDELFGGYERYRRFRDRQLCSEWIFGSFDAFKSRFRHRSWPRRSLNFLSLALSPPMSRWTKLMNGLTAGDKRGYAKLLEIPPDYDDYWAWREYWREDLPPATRLQYLDFHRYLPDVLLTKVDRTSMAVSLEVRVPLLDTRVVELAFRIPESVRFAGGPKGVLRTAYRGLLPDEVLDAPKSGFGIPRGYQSTAASYRAPWLLKHLFGIDFPPGFAIAPPVGSQEAA